MTSKDTMFMNEIEIEPSHLNTPSERLLPPLPPESLIPCLTEKDIFWLQKVGVPWGAEPAPDFVPPKNLPKYLEHYPHGIRRAVEVIAKELKLKLSDDEHDELAQQITVMLLECAQSAEDLVETYSLSSSQQLEENLSAHFHTYINLCIKAAILVLLEE
jgi:hypothetical protein